ncbi:unnamed protein product [Leuciscus chuanchicus]
MWHRVRSQRFTSSNFKRIVSQVADFNSLATSQMQLHNTSSPLHMHPQAGNLLGVCNFIFTELSAWACERWGYKTDIDVSKEISDKKALISHYYYFWLKEF